VCLLGGEDGVADERRVYDGENGVVDDGFFTGDAALRTSGGLRRALSGGRLVSCDLVQRITNFIRGSCWVEASLVRWSDRNPSFKSRNGA
jgi:hypothetical protein